MGLKYGEYINDAAIREALRMPGRPAGFSGEWPEPPVDWHPGDRWPRPSPWVHDEALFITVHQAFEIWFRQILHEIDRVIDDLSGESTCPRVALARRDPSRVPTLGTRRTSYPLASEVAEAAPFRLRTSLLNLPVPDVLGKNNPGQLSPTAESLRKSTQRLRRVQLIFEVATPGFDVLETMAPSTFLEFRGRLAPASGFGSAQFREIEILMGLREVHLHRTRWTTIEDNPPVPQLAALADELLPDDTEVRQHEVGSTRPHALFESHCSEKDVTRIVQRMLGTTLRDVVYALLSDSCTESPGESSALDRWLMEMFLQEIDLATRRSPKPDDPDPSPQLLELANAWAHSESNRAARLLRPDHQDSDVAEFLAACLDVDKALWDWRSRHISFVEMMIGAKPGTGGGGIAYLRDTINVARGEWLTRAFPSLWHARFLLS